MSASTTGGLGDAASAADRDATPHGLSEAEAMRRLEERGGMRRERTSRSYASIVRANVFTVFNAILAGFGTVTLIFADWRDALFIGVVVVNSAIGITQEVRAKRALDRLSLLIEPRARVVRDGQPRELPLEEVLVEDVVLMAPGDQVLADGRLLDASDLRLDESILTGESEPAARRAGEEVRSGAFVVEGAGSYEVTAVGADSFAMRLTGEARSFRHPRSPLERAVNRLLYALVGLVLALGALLGYSLYHRHVPLRTAVSTASAGVVSLIPEGLVVLMSLTYAVAAVRMSRRGILSQQLNAIESLASVDTICVDKTGTLTEPSLRVVETLPAAGVSEERLHAALAALAAAVATPNATLRAIGEAFPAEPRTPRAQVPFSSARRWSAVELGEGEDGALFLGAPGRLPLGSLEHRAQELQGEGRRVVALAAGTEPLPREGDAAPHSKDGASHGSETRPYEPNALPPPGLEPLGIVVLAERLREGIGETIAFLRREGVEIRVLSGDAPQTVAAIARDVGIRVTAVVDGEALLDDATGASPGDPTEATVVGRISPEGKQAFVRALAERGRYVAMVGDGVNDVPALKAARLAIAQGSGTQMARSVADLVLISGDFASVPQLVSEGRRALRNLQRVTKLYVTKSAFAAFLILTIGTSSEAYPLLPRHLTLVAALTIGIPTFFLALAPSSGPWRPEHFVRGVARFAVPAGVVVGTGVVAGYLFALHDLDLSVADARTVAVTTLVACGLYLVMALEGEGSRRRSTLVGGMCAVLAGAYVVALLLPSTRSFFALSVPNAGMLATSLLAGATSIGALALCGFTVSWSAR